MLAVRTPIAGIFIAVLVLFGEVVGLKAYESAHPPAKAPTIQVDGSKEFVSPPKFGRHRGCADKLRISGPDDIGPGAAQPTR
jgi:hypothetical protein